MSKQLYLFANWKMYLNHDESVALAQALRSVEYQNNLVVAVFPSALSFTAVKDKLAGSAVALGAQNVYWIDRGGYTGEVSAEMFAAAGARYALVGHSERRYQFKETNHEVRAKLEAVLAAGLTPVLCLGEVAAEREAGKTWEVLETQLRAAYSGLAWPQERELIVTYEPVWAISRGVDKWGGECAADEAEIIHTRIAGWLSGMIPDVTPRLLFGGSVRSATIAGYLAEPHIAGVLVGAAATKLESWEDIVKMSNA